MHRKDNPAPVLLRAPPFRPDLPLLAECDATWQGIRARVDRPLSPDELRVFDKLSSLRLGGDYVAPDVLAPGAEPRVLVSISNPRRAARIWQDAADRWGAGRLRVFAPGLRPGRYAALRRLIVRAGSELILDFCNPHSLLDLSVLVASERIDDLAVMGLVRGDEVLSWSPDGWIREIRASAANLVLSSTIYLDPFTRKPVSIDVAIDYLLTWRRIVLENRQISDCVGMAWWKQTRMAAFFSHAPSGPRFHRGGRTALSRAQAVGGSVALWATRGPRSLRKNAAKRGVPLLRVEDGFIRSLGLGSDFTPPSSIVLDRSGIYYDPSVPSDLETILSSHVFDDPLTARSRNLIDLIVSRRVSKYGGTGNNPTELLAGRRERADRTIILVPGQVADDASVRLGGGAIKSNLALLRSVRLENPDAWIIYRPHPDVDAGHRVGAIADQVVLGLADSISRGGAMIALIEQADEVHTMTSLAGFEGLLRGKRVCVWGLPFYAGWGLTDDRGAPCPRRGRRLTLEELVAGTLIVYPRYLDPITGLPCTPEILIERLALDSIWKPGIRITLRRGQGALRRRISHLRNQITRVFSNG